MDAFPLFPEPTIEVLRPEPGATLVILSGEHDYATSDELRQTLTRALDSSGQGHLIIDLSSADFVDSSTISALVFAKKHADEAGCKFNVVLATTPIVERALEITGVLPGLNRVETVDEALAS